MVKFARPSEMLKVFSQTADAAFICWMTFSRAVSEELKSAVYVQSVATPTRATFLVDGQPELSPIVDFKFTPALLPPVMSLCRLKMLEKSMDPKDLADRLRIAAYTGCSKSVLKCSPSE